MEIQNNLNSPSNLDLDNFSEISLENINFKYQNSDKTVFKNLNIKIKENDCIGIMGESGAGKTTLIHILLGLIKPQTGIIKLNGKKIDLTETMKSFSAYLPQDPIILDDTIENNISLEQDEHKIDSREISRFN